MLYLVCKVHKFPLYDHASQCSQIICAFVYYYLFCYEVQNSKFCMNSPTFSVQFSSGFQGKPFNITVIQAYAPTSNAEEAEVEWFYEDLQDLLELTPQLAKCWQRLIKALYHRPNKICELWHRIIVYCKSTHVINNVLGLILILILIKLKFYCRQSGQFLILYIHMEIQKFYLVYLKVIPVSHNSCQQWQEHFLLLFDLIKMLNNFKGQKNKFCSILIMIIQWNSDSM